MEFDGETVALRLSMSWNVDWDACDNEADTVADNTVSENSRFDWSLPSADDEPDEGTGPVEERGCHLW